jgi:predicted nicotinamide N-methyase
MFYPIKLHEFQGGLQLHVPDPDKVKPTYEHLVATNPATAFPFWAKIWPSSLALTSFLRREPQWIASKHVLEIGAGIGLPSFSISREASTLVISDYSTEAVALMEKNIQCLGLKHTRAMQLDWNHFPSDLAADTVLFSDINYEPEQFEALLTLIKQLLNKGATVIIATPERISAIAFAVKLEPYVSLSLLETVETAHQTMDIRIFVLSV